AAAAEQPGPPAGTEGLRPVAVGGFRKGPPPQQIKALEAAFAELAGKIATHRGVGFGPGVSPANRAQGYTHCFFLTFSDAAGRDAYRSHPAHQQFVKLALPNVEKLLVIDYWASAPRTSTAQP